MSMNLSQDDLQAIRGIVKEEVEAGVETLTLQTVAGFAEVHEKFTEVHKKLNVIATDLQLVKDTVSNIETVQRAEVKRVDKQSSTITKIRNTLKAV